MSYKTDANFQSIFKTNKFTRNKYLKVSDLVKVYKWVTVIHRNVPWPQIVMNYIQF